jgi:hypothetical protein
VFECSYERLLKFENSLLSNHPNAGAKDFYCAGRITVDAREKE